MASPLAEAITAGMVSQMDPMNAITRNMATGMVETQQVELTRTKAGAITEIEQLLTQAQARNADQTVVTAYQKLLARLTS